MARTSSTDKQPNSESDSCAAVGNDAQASTEKTQSSEVTVYPLRTYLDGKDMRRVGEPYQVAKHEAAVLKAKKLATDEKPKD